MYFYDTCALINDQEVAFKEPFVIADGERIAQMVIARHEQVEWCEVEVLADTERGAGGFGHTGV